MSPDRPSRRTPPPPPAPQGRENKSSPTADAHDQNPAQDRELKPREPWVEQWLADEEDDVWNMPCTD